MSLKNVWLVGILLISLDIKAQLNTYPDSGYVSGEVLIQCSGKKDLESALTKLQLINGTESQLRLSSVLAPELGIYLCKFNSTAISHPQLLKSLKSIPEVILAQNNHYIENRSTPNDPQFANMWAMNNTGQNGGTIDADIDAPEAWDISTGGLTTTGDTIVVAVIDGGFFLAHQDINFWKNYNEIPGDNIDNDGNGYIDDVNGWNAYNNSGNITSDSHGTHVAGTVGAKGNNTLGVTGVNWNVKVMGVSGSSETESVVVIAYNYVLKQRLIYNRTNGDSGAFVVSTNASFGKDYGLPVNFPIWCAIYDSLGKAGIISCGATANRNIDVDVQGDIPTTCTSPYLISVTNTTRADVKYASGAAWGLTHIDLGAPGSSILSTYPSNTYSTSTGTSMATPHVAGTVGLMFSAAPVELINQYKSKPDSVALLFKNWILCSTDPLNDLNGRTVTGGRLNVANSLGKVIGTSSCLVSSSEIKNDPQKSSLFSIWPNPLSGSTLNINYFAHLNEQAFLTIYNTLGEEVDKVKLNFNGIGFHNHNLYMPVLSSGTYFVRISSPSENSNFQKLIVVN